MLLVSHTGRSGAAIPFATMTAAQQLTNGDWRVTDAEGETHLFSQADWKTTIETTPVAVLPALPGTYVVEPNREDDEPPYWRSNVLGWSIGLDGETRPIVLDYEAIMDRWHVLHPDGRVERSGGGSWDDAASWLEAMRSKT